MLKYQVRTLNRERKPRKSLYQLFDDPQTPGSSTGSSGSPSPTGSNDSTNSFDTAVTPLRCETSPASRGTSTLRVDGSRSVRSMRRNARSTSVSSLTSGSSSSSEHHVEWGPMRVFTGAFRAECDYKTMFINTSTTTDDLIQLILAKFPRYRSKYKDPKLFQLNMDVLTKHESKSVETSLVLSSDAKPLEMQNYHPKDRSRFTLHVRQAVQVKIFDYHIFHESNYRSLLISDQTTCHEVIGLLYQSHRAPRPPSGVGLCIFDRIRNRIVALSSKDVLYHVLREPWVNPDVHQVHIVPALKTPREIVPCESTSGFTARLVPSTDSQKNIDFGLCDHFRDFCSV